MHVVMRKKTAVDFNTATIYHDRVECFTFMISLIMINENINIYRILKSLTN